MKRYGLDYPKVGDVRIDGKLNELPECEDDVIEVPLYLILQQSGTDCTMLDFKNQCLAIGELDELKDMPVIMERMDVPGGVAYHPAYRVLCFAKRMGLEGGICNTDVLSFQYERKVHALDSAGSKKWAVSAGTFNPVVGGPRSYPSFADGTVYVGSLDGKVYVIDGTTGTEKYTIAAGDRVDSNIQGAPAIGNDGTVYFMSSEGTVFAAK